MSNVLTNTEKIALTQIASGADTSLARRATIILMSDRTLDDIAAEVALSSKTVKRWQQKFKKKRLSIFPEEVLAQFQAAQAEQNTSPTPKPGARKGIGLDPDDTLAEAGRKVIGFHFGRMLAHEAGTILGEDIEELHDMRVATRRMRAAFQLFAPGFSERVSKDLFKRLRITGRALGPTRDMDVFIEKVYSYQNSLPETEPSGLQPLLDIWQAKRETARAEMLAYLDSKAYRTFKEDMATFINTPGLGAKKKATAPIKEVAPALIQNRYEAVLTYDANLMQASMEELHDLRLAVKALRYTVEYFREILGPSCESVIDQLKLLQDHLGQLNDAHVAEGILCDFLTTWEDKRLLTERYNLAPMGVYLTAKLRERHQLLMTMPEAWQRFRTDEFRVNLEAMLQP